MGLRRVRHNKFFRVLTIVGASLGVLASGTLASFLAMDVAEVNPFITDELRTYSAKFMNGGTVLSEATYNRGELVETPETPAHEVDGEKNYLFIGWDLTGNGLPDILPPRIYNSFTARAVFLPIGDFDISFLDLENMDLEKLLDLLEKLNIDWEQFMDMFNIDPETLLEWLKKNAVLTFEADESAYISYFRSTSYGDYNYSTKTFNSPSFYDSKKISDGSVNPLNYTADKLYSASRLTGTLPQGFEFINYDITFKTKQDYYPVPDCQQPKDEDNLIDSDAHYLKSPINNKYYTYAAYAPAFNETVNILKMVPFSNMAITNDERVYYRYALENYTKIPTEYESVIDRMILENDWYEEDYGQINQIGAYVENLGSCSLFKDGEINLKYKKNKDPVMGLIENEQGTDLDFNVTAMMIFRRLNIPARIVKGYVVPNIESGENVVTLLNQHYWCEIYVKNVGWMICDCMNAEDMLGTNPYGELDKKNNPLEDDKDLEYIQIERVPNKTIYKQYDSFDKTGLVVNAYYSDDTSEDVTNSCKFEGFDSSELGWCTVTVTYKEGSKTCEDYFDVEVTERGAEIERVDFDFTNFQTEYYVGDKLNTKGIKVTAYYSDGSEVDVTKELKTVSSTYNMNNTGRQRVRFYVELEGEQYTEDRWITVNEKYIVSISVSKLPTKTTYYVGEKAKDVDLTGMVVNVTYNNDSIGKYEKEDLKKLTAETEDFLSKTDAHPIRIWLYNEIGDTIETYFNVEVLANAVSGLELSKDIQDEFTVGDYITAEELLGDSHLIVKYYNGMETEITDPSKYEVIVPEDLTSETGTKYVTIRYDNDGEMIENNIPITIKAVNEKEFSISNKVSTAGPGEGMSAKDIFTFTTAQEGTIYFYSGSYNSYSPETGWTNDFGMSSKVSDYDIGDLTYNKASTAFESYDIEINYLTDMEKALAPEYSSYQESALNVKKNAGDKDNYSFTNFAITQENLNRLRNYVSYSSDAISSKASTFNMYLYTDYINKGNNSYDVITSYINQKGFSYYTYDEYELITRVKNALQTDFTYNINFKYDSNKDPVISFFEQREGICNNFATAATLIFRNLGLPARYVTGFGANSTGGTTTVNTNKAHAWCEVYLSNIGWVIVDATGYDDGHTGSGVGGSGYYGDGFGGESEGGLYNSEKKYYGGTINITYTMPSIFEYDDEYDIWYVEYDAKDFEGFGGVIRTTIGDTVPDYLDVYVEYENRHNSSAGYVEITPTLHVVDRMTGEDVTAEYGYVLGAGAEGIDFLIDARIIIVSVTPNEASYSLNGNSSVTLSSSDFTYEITYGSLADVDSIYLYGSVTFDTQGTYGDYEGMHIGVMYGAGSYDSYVVIIDLGEVVITP